MGFTPSKNKSPLPEETIDFWLLVIVGKIGCPVGEKLLYGGCDRYCLTRLPNLTRSYIAVSNKLSAVSLCAERERIIKKRSLLGAIGAFS